ncbi:hypothetical protein BJV82DRAFT_663904 [Fennellomyces sp. T-0311]|nr:hypothetical protein BJV82DRAFT_663904 [Fennellomyces sp. T-0311]
MSYETWHDIQTLTIGYLNEVLLPRNFDLIVANPTQLKLIGSIREGGEDTYIHDVLAPLLDITFAFNTALGHFRAKISLDKAHQQYKTDYGVYANGLSKKCVVLVAEFKPREGRQRQESDFIKIGKEMRTMLNRLIMIYVHNPVVCGNLVGGNRISTFKMELKASQIYAMVQLSDLPLIRNSDDLNLIPLLVAKLQQVKEYSLQTAQKVQALSKLIRQGHTSVSSVPTSWINNNFYSVQKVKNEDTLQ